MANNLGGFTYEVGLSLAGNVQETLNKLKSELTDLNKSLDINLGYQAVTDAAKAMASLNQEMRDLKTESYIVGKAIKDSAASYADNFSKANAGATGVMDTFKKMQDALDDGKNIGSKSVKDMASGLKGTIDSLDAEVNRINSMMTDLSFKNIGINFDKNATEEMQHFVSAAKSAIADFNKVASGNGHVGMQMFGRKNSLAERIAGVYALIDSVKKLDVAYETVRKNEDVQRQLVMSVVPNIDVNKLNLDELREAMRNVEISVTKLTLTQQAVSTFVEEVSNREITLNKLRLGNILDLGGLGETVKDLDRIKGDLQSLNAIMQRAGADFYKNVGGDKPLPIIDGVGEAAKFAEALKVALSKESFAVNPDVRSFVDKLVEGVAAATFRIGNVDVSGVTGKIEEVSKKSAQTAEKEKMTLTDVVAAINGVKEAIGGIDFSKAFNPEVIEGFKNHVDAAISTITEKLGSLKVEATSTGSSVEAAFGQFGKDGIIGFADYLDIISDRLRSVHNNLSNIKETTFMSPDLYGDYYKNEAESNRLASVRDQYKASNTAIREYNQELRNDGAEIENNVEIIKSTMSSFKAYVEGLTIEPNTLQSLEKEFDKLNTIAESDTNRGVNGALEGMVARLETCQEMLINVFNTFDFELNKETTNFAFFDALQSRVTSTVTEIEEMKDRIQTAIDDIETAENAADRKAALSEAKDVLQDEVSMYESIVKEAETLQKLDTQQCEDIMGAVKAESELRDSVEKTNKQLNESVERSANLKEEMQELDKTVKTQSTYLNRTSERKNVFSDILETIREVSVELKRLSETSAAIFASSVSGKAGSSELVSQLREEATAAESLKTALAKIDEYRNKHIGRTSTESFVNIIDNYSNRSGFSPLDASSVRSIDTELGRRIEQLQTISEIASNSVRSGIESPIKAEIEALSVIMSKLQGYKANISEAAENGRAMDSRDKQTVAIAKDAVSSIDSAIENLLSKMKEVGSTGRQAILDEFVKSNSAIKDVASSAENAKTSVSAAFSQEQLEAFAGHLNEIKILLASVVEQASLLGTVLKEGMGVGTRSDFSQLETNLSKVVDVINKIGGLGYSTIDVTRIFGPDGDDVAKEDRALSRMGESLQKVTSQWEALADVASNYDKILSEIVTKMRSGEFMPQFGSGVNSLLFAELPSKMQLEALEKSAFSGILTYDQNSANGIEYYIRDLSKLKDVLYDIKNLDDQFYLIKYKNQDKAIHTTDIADLQSLKQTGIDWIYGGDAWQNRYWADNEASVQRMIAYLQEYAGLCVELKNGVPVNKAEYDTLKSQTSAQWTESQKEAVELEQQRLSILGQIDQQQKKVNDTKAASSDAKKALKEYDEDQKKVATLKDVVAAVESLKGALSGLGGANVQAAFNPEQVERFAKVLMTVVSELKHLHEQLVIIAGKDIKIPAIDLGGQNLKAELSGLDALVGTLTGALERLEAEYKKVSDGQAAAAQKEVNTEVQKSIDFDEAAANGVRQLNESYLLLSQTLEKLSVEMGKVSGAIGKLFSDDGAFTLTAKLDALVSSFQSAAETFAKAGGNVTFVSGVEGVEAMTAALGRMNEMAEKVDAALSGLGTKTGGGKTGGKTAGNGGGAAGAVAGAAGAEAAATETATAATVADTAAKIKNAQAAVALCGVMERLTSFKEREANADTVVQRRNAALKGVGQALKELEGLNKTSAGGDVISFAIRDLQEVQYHLLRVGKSAEALKAVFAGNAGIFGNMGDTFKAADIENMIKLFVGLEREKQRAINGIPVRDNARQAMYENLFGMKFSEQMATDPAFANNLQAQGQVFMQEYDDLIRKVRMKADELWSSIRAAQKDSNQNTTEREGIHSNWTEYLKQLEKYNGDLFAMFVMLSNSKAKIEELASLQVRATNIDRGLSTEKSLIDNMVVQETKAAQRMTEEEARATQAWNANFDKQVESRVQSIQSANDKLKKVYGEYEALKNKVATKQSRTSGEVTVPVDTREAEATLRKLRVEILDLMNMPIRLRVEAVNSAEKTGLFGNLMKEANNQYGLAVSKAYDEAKQESARRRSESTSQREAERDAEAVRKAYSNAIGKIDKEMEGLMSRRGTLVGAGLKHDIIDARLKELSAQKGMFEVSAATDGSIENLQRITALINEQTKARRELTAQRKQEQNEDNRKTVDVSELELAAQLRYQAALRNTETQLKLMQQAQADAASAGDKTNEAVKVLTDSLNRLNSLPKDAGYKVLNIEASQAASQMRLANAYKKAQVAENKENNVDYMSKLSKVYDKVIDKKKELDNLHDSKRAKGQATDNLDKEIDRYRRILALIEKIQASGNEKRAGRFVSVADDIFANMGMRVRNANRSDSAIGKSEAEAWRNATNEQRGFQSQTMQTLASVVSLDQQFSMLAMTIQNAFSIMAIQQFAEKIIQVGGELEKQQLAMNSILGDEHKSAQIFEQVSELSMVSPFDVQDLVKNTKQLSAFGVEYDHLYDTVKRLSDISAAVGVDFGRIAYEYGQMESMGYLDRRHLRMFSMSGVPLAQELKKYYSSQRGEDVSQHEIDKMIAKREISAQVVKDILADMTNEGGKFYNMQEIMAESLSSKWRNLGNAVNLMYGKLAKSGEGDFLKGLAESLTELTYRFEELSRVMGIGIGGFILGKGVQAIYAAATNATAVAIASEELATKKLTAEQITQIITDKALTEAQMRKLAMSKKLTLSQLTGMLASSKLSVEQKNNCLRWAGLTKAQAAYVVGTGKATIATMRLRLAMVSLQKWAATNWLMLTITAVAALGGAMYNAYKESHKLQDALDDLEKESNANRDKEIGGIDMLMRKLKAAKGDYQKYAEVIQELQTKYPEYFQNLKTEAQYYEEVAAAADKAKNSIRAKMAAQLQEDQVKEVYDNYADSIKKQKDATKTAISAELKRLGRTDISEDAIMSEIEKLISNEYSVEEIGKYIQNILGISGFNVENLTYGKSSGSDVYRTSVKNGGNGLLRLIEKIQERDKKAREVEEGAGVYPYQKTADEIAKAFEPFIARATSEKDRLTRVASRNNAIKAVLSAAIGSDVTVDTGSGIRNFKGAGIESGEIINQYISKIAESRKAALVDWKTKAKDIFSAKSAKDVTKTTNAGDKTFKASVIGSAIAADLSPDNFTEVDEYYKSLAKKRKEIQKKKEDLEESGRNDESTMATLARSEEELRLLDEYAKALNINWAKWEKDSNEKKDAVLDELRKELGWLKTVNDLYKDSNAGPDTAWREAKASAAFKELRDKKIIGSDDISYEQFINEVIPAFSKKVKASTNGKREGDYTNLSIEADKFRRTAQNDEMSRIADMTADEFKANIDKGVQSWNFAKTAADIYGNLEGEIERVFGAAGVDSRGAKSVTEWLQGLIDREGVVYDWESLVGKDEKAISNAIFGRDRDELTQDDSNQVKRIKILVDAMKAAFDEEISSIREELHKEALQIKQKIDPREKVKALEDALALNLKNADPSERWLIEWAGKREIADAQLEVLKQNGSPIGKLFTSGDQKSIGIAFEALKKVKKVLEYIRNGKKGQLPKDFKKEDIDRISENYETLSEIINQVTSETDAFWSKFGSDGIGGAIGGIGSGLDHMKTYKETLEEIEKKKESLTGEEKDNLKKAANYAGNKAFASFAGAFGAAAGFASDICGKLKEMADTIHDEGLSESMEKASAFAQNVKAAGSGASNGGGWIGAVIGGASDMLGQIVDGITTVVTEEEEAANNARDFRHQLELLALTIKSEDYKNIFGTENILMAVDAYKAMQDAQKSIANFSWSDDALFNDTGNNKRSAAIKSVIDDYEQQLKLMEIKVTDRNAWQNFWGKDDDYAMLGDLAPELWDENGKLNYDKLKLLLDTNTQLTEQQRDELQQLYDLNEAYKEAKKVVEDLISSWTGSWAGALSDGIFDAIISGASAWDAFEKAGSDAILSLGKQMMNEMLFQQYFKQFEEPLSDTFGITDSNKRLDAQMTVFGQIMEGLPSVYDTAMAWGQEFIDRAEQEGYDFSENASGVSDSLQGMTEETADIIAAYLNGIRGDVSQEVLLMENIDKNVSAICQAIAGNAIAPMAEMMGAGTYDLTDVTDLLSEGVFSLGGIQMSLEEMAWSGIPTLNANAESQLQQLEMQTEYLRLIQMSNASLMEDVNQMRSDLHSVIYGNNKVNI